MSGAGDHVAAYLREADRDRYFASLLLPERARPGVQALLAMSADIASIRDRAREPVAGEIRLQWWVDALAGSGHGNVRQNPVAAAVLDAVAAWGLPTPALQRLLAARRFDLYDDPMPDITSFEGYAGETVSVLYQLAAMILEGGGEVANGDAAGHLGVAHALIGHLRAFGYNASRGRLFLPWAFFAANGVAEAELFSGTDSEGLRAALGQLAELAHQHLGAARPAIAALPRAVRPAFAHLPLLKAQLARAERAAPFAPPADLADWRKIAIMGWWTLRNG